MEFDKTSQLISLLVIMRTESHKMRKYNHSSPEYHKARKAYNDALKEYLKLGGVL